MEIRSESRINYPRAKVYETYRDKLREIAAYMPDIREIVVHSREEADGIVKLHNEWISDREVPKVVAKIIKPEHLRWDDHATWHDEGFYVDWIIKTRAFTDAVTCSGRNSMIAVGDNATIVRLTGELKITVTGIPGVPSFLAKRLAPQVEKFIVGLITPNLKNTNKSLQDYLDAES